MERNNPATVIGPGLAFLMGSGRGVNNIITFTLMAWRIGRGRYRQIFRRILVSFIGNLKDHKFYIGYTSNLRARVNRHNRGGNISTKHRRPLELVYNEVYDTKLEAMRREREIKGYKGGIKFKKLLKL